MTNSTGDKAMDFGDAIAAMKAGKRVARAGWNGKGMHVYLEDRIHAVFPRERGGPHQREYEPCLVLFTAQGKHQPGWNASTPDVLAEDWQIVE